MRTNQESEMLLGLMKISKAEFGIATTGIAGPIGRSEEKPIGTVFIAMGAAGKKPRILETVNGLNFVFLRCFWFFSFFLV